MLRAQGTPARARCGFGGYFGSGTFEDHWVCEYWDEAAQGWKLADFQIDEVQLKLFDVDFDLTDVPREAFLVAGDAWRLCRAGQADPAKFGLSLMNEAGYWWIAANLVRDVAALNNMEMLPWDVWGAMPAPADTINDEQYALFDRLAELTRVPDADFADLTAAYAGDTRLRVPATVRNAVLNRTEPILDEDREQCPPKCPRQIPRCECVLSRSIPSPYLSSGFASSADAGLLTVSSGLSVHIADSAAARTRGGVFVGRLGAAAALGGLAGRDRVQLGLDGVPACSSSWP